MKTCIKKLFFLPALIAGLGLILTGQVTAQTFTTLHSFTNSPDGAQPWAGLILSGNTLYGTATAGGTNRYGTVFAVNTDGSGYTNLYSFTALNPNTETNSDGADPIAGLILSGDTLYGTAEDGGTNGLGTVFALNTNGTGFRTLHTFTTGAFDDSLDTQPYTNSDGYNPYGGLILSGNTLYGTANLGGSGGNGTVFAVNTDGSGFTNIYSFTATSAPVYDQGTNSDGANPYDGLILSGNTLYGTAYGGGTNGWGTVFAVSTNGTLTNLYSFGTIQDTNGNPLDGADLRGGLVLSGNTLYGTAILGGANGNGTVFAVNTDGSGFTNIYSFTVGDYVYAGFYTNSDGYAPYAGLVLSGDILYGTAVAGGSGDNGTVFAVTTNGIGFTNLHSFTYLNPDTETNSDGAAPIAGLILSGNTLYGTAETGGSYYGTVFSLSLPVPPRLAIILSGTNVILTWPTNATGFTLQFTTNLAPPAVWSTVSGQFAVTNPISGTRKFYRLSQ